MTTVRRGKSDPLATWRATVRAHRGLYLGDGPTFAPAGHGLLVLGPPRSGKTSSIVIPNVLGANGAVLVASTKTDVLAATASARRAVGRVLVFDPSGSAEIPKDVERVGWSPLIHAAEWDRAVLGADAMVGASRSSGGGGEHLHWSERAGALLAPVLHGAALEGLEMSEVIRAIHRRDVTPFLEVLAHRDASLALDQLVGIVETDERERSGIFSTASSVLAAYRTTGAIATTRLPPFEPDRFLDDGESCYILGSGEQQRHLAPLVAGIIGDIRHAAYARHATGTPAPTALLVLDELANIAPLDDLPSLVAEGASQGLVTIACLQDLSQARVRWGDAADGFLSLFGTKVVLPGIGDRRTLEALSLLAGEMDVTTVSRSIERRGRRRTRTTSTRRERRVPPDAIANGPAGSAIVVVGADVARISLTAAHRTPEFSALLGTETAIPARRGARGSLRARPPVERTGLGR